MNWKKVKIGDFLINRDNRYKPLDKEINGLKRIEKIDFSGHIYISNKLSNTDMILIKKGDLVISGINVEKGAMNIYEGEEDLTATIHYSSYIFDKERIDLDYLKSFLKSPEFKEAIKVQVPGGIKTEIKPKHLLPIEIEIPESINDQKNIVKKLQSQNTKIQNLKSETSHQLDLLKKLKQQILQDAVQGKLVKQNPKDELATVLLEKIKAEKEKLISEKKLKPGKPLPPIKEDEIPFQIPENWVWCRLGEIGIISPRNYADDDLNVSFIPMPLISAKFGVNPEFEIRKWKNIKTGFTHFANDDVAIAKITPCFENSKASVFKNLKNGIGAGTTELHVFRGNTNFISPKYIYINLKTIRLLIDGEMNMRGVAGQKRVPTDYFKEFEIPLPPLSEQHRIVSKVEELIKKSDELEASIKQGQIYAEQLMQLVLRDALKPGGE